VRSKRSVSVQKGRKGWMAPTTMMAVAFFLGFVSESRVV